MLSSCSEMLIRASDETSLLAEACRIAVEIGGYRMAWVGYVIEDVQQRIRPMAHAGEILGDSSEDPLFCGGEMPCCEAIFTGQTVVVAEARREADGSCFAAHARKSAYPSAVSLPLRAEGKVLGALCLYGAELHAVSDDEIQMLGQMANDLSFGIANIRSREVRQRTEAVIIKVAQTVSGTIGSEFFDLLVGNMVEALGANVGLIGKLNPATHSIDASSYLLNGKLIEKISYDLAGTPCENVADGAACVLERDVQRLFPQDHMLARLGIEAYVGIPLLNHHDEVAGVMAVLFTSPLHETALVTSTLRIFAARAASELDRQQADARIREQASLLDKARDAILVRGLDHRITYWNKSAERLYGWTAEEAIGRSVVELLYQEKSGYFEAHAQTLIDGEWAGDFTQIHQVLLNLCVNASDAISGAGRISISGKNVQLDASFAAANLEASEGPYVCIRQTLESDAPSA